MGKVENVILLSHPSPRLEKVLDQTERFLVTSSKGNKYIMIMYNYDSNNILGEALRSRTGDKLLRAFTKYTSS